MVDDTCDSIAELSTGTEKEKIFYFKLSKKFVSCYNRYTTS